MCSSDLEIHVAVGAHVTLDALLEETELRVAVVAKKPERIDWAVARLVHLIGPREHVTVEACEPIRATPAVDECAAVSKVGLAFVRLVLAPVEFEQLNEIEEFQETRAVLLIRVVARAKQIAEGEVMSALGHDDFEIGNRRAIFAREMNHGVTFAVCFDAAGGLFQHG